MRYLRFAPVVCIGAMLVATFRLYTFAYFWLDDFANTHWVRGRTLWEGLGYILSPSAKHFRPVGMLAYQTAYNLFDQDPQPYHWIMWAVHVINIALLYAVLKSLTKSRAGALTGALLFAGPAVFNDIFWSFGTIFELTGAAFFFTGILLWDREKRSPAVVLAAMAAFVLALKSKEMAITLPVIWLLQDLLLRRPLQWRALALFALPGLVGAWFGLQKLSEMRAPDPLAAYYMDLQGITMGYGLSYYLNALFATQFRWQVWCIGFAAVMLLLGVLRWRLALFFQLYVFVTFLPVIFLSNHRDPFYWYFPMLGVCGIAALLTRAVADWTAQRVPEPQLTTLASLVFAALCLGMYVRSSSETEDRRSWQRGLAEEYRGFVDSLQALPPPNPGDTLFFKSTPRNFDEPTLRFAAEFALHRTDIDVRLVKEFPPEARYRLDFEGSDVILQ